MRLLAAALSATLGLLFTNTASADFVARRREAELLVEQADRSKGATAKPLYEEGGRRYRALFEDTCKDPNQEDARLCEETVWSASRAFVAAGMLAKAIEATRALLLHAELTHSQSPLVVRASFEMGRMYQSIAIFDLAADWHERSATLFFGEKEASKAMLDAIVLRLALGQGDLATKDGSFFIDKWGRSRPAEVAQVVLLFATQHLHRDAPEQARKLLEANLGTMDRAPLDLRIQGHALLAKAAPVRASAEWAIVLSLYRDSLTATAALRAAWPGDEDWQIDRRLGRILVAVSEAALAHAEERRVAELSGSKVPTFPSGAINRIAIEAFIGGPLREWSEQRRAAISRVEAEYARVLEVKPFPSPVAVIAAAAAMGRLWSDLAAELERVPARLRGGPSAKEYRAAARPLHDALFLAHAKPAMQQCVALSVRYELGASDARTCRAWLEEHAKDEFARVEELLPKLRADAYAPASPLP